MSFDDFHLVPKGVSCGKYASKKPLIDDMQICKFVKGSKQIFWKTSYDQIDYDGALSLQKKIVKTLGTDFSQVTAPRRVKPDKKQNILNVLCPFMSVQCRKLWEDLVENENSADLVKERGADEEIDEALTTI